MTATMTKSASATFTTLDIEKVMRRVKADLIMIADSTGGWTREKAEDYAHDCELLTQKGYLANADVTLFDDGVEVQATRFTTDTDAGDWTSSRPGLMWPRVANPYLRIILSYTDAYTADARAAMKPKLRIGWSPSSADTSHSSLIASGGRDYASNAFGVKRTDWSK